MIFVAKICETTYKCNERVDKLEAMQGLFAIPAQERKFSNGKEATAEIFLKKQKELNEQRMECRLQSSGKRRLFQPIKWKSSD